MATMTASLATLLRLRRENQAGRMVAGLGARNVAWARAHSGGLAANIAGIGGDVSAADQTAFAERQLAILDAHVARIEARIKRLQNLANRTASRVSGPGPDGSGGSISARQTLAQRLQNKGFGLKRGKIELGPVELGAGGIGLNGGYLRGAGGRLFAVAMVGQAVGGVINTYANAGDAIKRIRKEGGSAGEMLRQGGLSVAGGFRQTVGSLIGFDSITEGILRLRGLSATDAQNTQRKFYEDMFTSKEQLARKKDAQEKQLKAMYAEVDKAVGALWVKVNSTLPSTFALRKSDLKRFREELREINRVAINARADSIKNQAKREQEARIAAGN